MKVFRIMLLNHNYRQLFFQFGERHEPTKGYVSFYFLDALMNFVYSNKKWAIMVMNYLDF